ncbi:hypothetical protein QAD02_021142 [Eretmocerus hayati]|uniref:Uncharacterized protein n=1 Tax=Eretmocerus hayati TaxID=131215 RepID=A0ACC2PPW9_9HYME|nr:hypothetical protein QAD02_021142 [Eretmocerus hayati]
MKKCQELTVKKDESSKKKIYTYYMVEFINRGKKPRTKCVDVVLKKWFTTKKYKEAQRAQVRYPKNPQDEGYQYRLENSLPADEDNWPCFTVEALIQMSLFTSMMHHQSYHTRKPPHGASHTPSGTAIGPKTDPDLKSKIYKELTCSSQKLSKSHKSSMVNTENITVEHHAPNDVNRISKANSCSQQLPMKQKRQESVDKAESYSSNLLSVKSDSQVLTDLKGVKRSMVHLASEFHKGIESLKSMIAKISVGEHVSANLVDDHEKLSKGSDFNIPFVRTKYFEIFYARLASDEGLVAVVTSLLKTQLDTTSIPKPFKRMIRMFMSKRAAEKWTAIQKVKHKKVLKNTNIFKIARSMYSQFGEKSAAQRKETISDQQCRNSLSQVLTNVHGWTVEESELCDEVSTASEGSDSEQPDNSRDSEEDSGSSSDDTPELSERDSSGSNDPELTEHSKNSNDDPNSEPDEELNSSQPPITHNFPNDLYDNYEFLGIEENNAQNE